MPITDTADIETLCNLATQAARKLEGYQDTSTLADDIDFVIHRIRRNIAEPIVDDNLRISRKMNRNPRSNMED